MLLYELLLFNLHQTPILSSQIDRNQPEMEPPSEDKQWVSRTPGNERARETLQGSKLDGMLINIVRFFLTCPEQASKYLLDPLTAPDPNEETGPGSHFTRAPSTSKAPAVPSSSKTPAVSSYPTPPSSASPTRSLFHPSNPYSASSSSSHRHTAFGAYPNAGPSRRSIDEPTGSGTGRRRGSSLGERFPGENAFLRSFPKPKPYSIAMKITNTSMEITKC